MKIKCEKCGFEEAPENFHGIIQKRADETDYPRKRVMWMVFIECPICNEETFFQHFPTDIPDGQACLSSSHLLNVSVDEAQTREEAEKLHWKKLQELKSKYNTP